MQKWQAKQKQRNHEAIMKKAKPTLNMNSHSRDGLNKLNEERQSRESKKREKQSMDSRRKQKLSVERVKKEKQLMGKTSKDKLINYEFSRETLKKASHSVPFVKILAMYKMEKYKDLFFEYGFPHTIAQKQSMEYLSEMINKVDLNDKQRFISFMETLLALTDSLQKPIKNQHLQNKVVSKGSYFPPTSKAKRTPNFRIKKNLKSVGKPGQQTKKKEENSKEKNLEYTIKKTNKIYHDDSQIVHNFASLKHNQVVHISKTNNIIKKLLKRIALTSAQEPNPQITLQYQKINALYLSFDNGKLTSNIVNIDIQQLTDCFAKSIAGKVQTTSLDVNSNEVVELLKESLLLCGLYEVQQKLQTTQKQKRQSDEVFGEPQIQSGEGSFESEDPQSNILEQTWISMAEQSTLLDFKCFDSKKQDIANIKNFVQLVMISGKLQKEAPILAHAYIERILNVKERRLTCRNWKNIVFISLVLASKIWDDRSLQNKSFSKAIPTYTTLEINRLEKHLVGFLDYKLTVDGKEYCKSYFDLRKHSLQADKTAHLTPLSIDTIHKLLHGGKKTQKKLKFLYQGQSNKSF